MIYFSAQNFFIEYLQKHMMFKYGKYLTILLLNKNKKMLMYIVLILTNSNDINQMNNTIEQNLNNKYIYQYQKSVKQVKLQIQMSCDQSDKQLTVKQQTAEHLENMLQYIRPKARYLSEMHVQEYIDSIYMEIINGDTSLPKQPISYGNEQKKKNDFEEQLKRRVKEHAERQKRYLEQKLNHLDRSLDQLSKDQKNMQRNHRHSVSYNTPHEKEQWRKQIKQRGKQLEKKKQEIQEKKRKKMEELKQIEERIKNQQQQAKKKEILEGMKAIEQRTKQREEQVKQANEKYKEIKKNKSLFEKIHDSYNQRQTSILEERKKKLAEIRNLHKPIDSSEILEHEQKFLQLKKQKQQMREREKRMNESRSNSYQPFYRSVFYKKALEDSRLQEENAELMKRQKIKQFSEHVKQCFVPEIDEKKRQQLEEYLEKQQRKIQKKRQRQQQLLFESKNKGQEYLDLVKKMPKKRKDKSNVQIIASQTDRREYKNYLRNSLDQSNAKKSVVRPWNKILTSSNDKQSKALMLQIQSQKREEELKRKEQQIRLLKQGNSEDIDEQYFQMIKAKLDLLQTNNSSQKAQKNVR